LSLNRANKRISEKSSPKIYTEKSRMGWFGSSPKVGAEASNHVTNLFISGIPKSVRGRELCPLSFFTQQM
jgi:hypothetical protein